MKTILVALGLSSDADESAATAEVQKLVALESGVKQIAGKTDPQEVIGVVAAWKMKAEKYDVVEAELTKLKSDAIAEQKKALIDEAIKSGVAPAKRPELEALELSALKVCLSLLPKAAPAAIEPPTDAPITATGGLTADQVKILKLTGLTPEKYAEHKKVLAQIVNPTEEN